MRKGLIINFTVEYFNFILLNPAYISETHFQVYQALRLSGIITVIITTCFLDEFSFTMLLQYCVKRSLFDQTSANILSICGKHLAGIICLMGMITVKGHALGRRR